jgi:hypothetical protein
LSGCGVVGEVWGWDWVCVLGPRDLGGADEVWVRAW